MFNFFGRILMTNTQSQLCLYEKSDSLSVRLSDFGSGGKFIKLCMDTTRRILLIIITIYTRILAFKRHQVFILFFISILCF